MALSSHPKLTFPGHTAKDCTNAYKVYGNDVEDLDPDEAWQKCMAADTDDDLDNFKKYFSAYCKAAPTMDFPTLQTAFREANMKTWLVAKVSGPSKAGNS